MKEYFERDYANANNNYYSQDGKTPGQWHGRLAEELGLTGGVTAEHFCRLAEGQHPFTGEQLIQHRKGKAVEEGREAEHTAGWDIVLRPGKSVSLAGLVGGDKRLQQVVRDANEKAMQKYELYIQQRMGGNRGAQTTAKWIRATFEHDTARPVDGYPAPLQHFHNIIPNMTAMDGAADDETGQARAVWFREVYKAQSYAHAIFHSEVAKGARELGYKVKRGEAHSVDIVGFSKEYLSAESKGSKRIRERLQAIGIDYTPLAADIAAKEWREAKLDLTPEQVREIHRAHGEAYGSQAEKIVQEAMDRGPVMAERVATPEKAVEFARRRLAERTAVFDRYEIARDALRYGAGTVDVDQVEAEIDRRVAAGNLVAVEHFRGTAPGARYTTPEMIQLEQDTIARVAAGRDTMEPIQHDADLSSHPDLQDNKPRQKVLEGFLKSTDQVTALNGTAGSGKSTAFQIVKEIAEREGFAVKGLAPSGKARDEFTAKGIASETLQRHVVAVKVEPPKEERIVYLLDEASLADARRMNEFIRSLRPQDRAILIGDDAADPAKVGQHTSVEAGRMFQELQQAGMKTAQLNRVYRQKTPELKQVVGALRHGKTKEAVNLLVAQKRVHTCPNRAERYSAIAEAYATFAGSQLVVSPDNKSREEINTAIRKALREHGKLSKGGYDMPILVARDVTGMDRTRVSSYREGDVVKYIRDNEELGVKGKSYGTVLAADSDKNILTVQTDAGKVIRYDPSRTGSGVSVYEKRVQEFAAGERVQFTARSKELATSTRDTGIVKAIDKQGNIEVVLDRSGRRVRWNLKNDSHLDYAYTMTSHSSQSMTVDRVLLNIETMDSRLRALINRTFAYVAGSRMREEMELYTDDPERLVKVLSRENEATKALSPEQIVEVKPEHKAERLQMWEMSMG